jgi:hypothetical protein
MAQKMLESFARLGWRHWGEDGAALLGPKGCAPAAIVHRAGNTWHGYVERGSRHLRYPAPTMLSAIARIEQAEAAGFFSPLWRNASPVPTRLGWEHGVNDGLDYWEAVLQRPGWWILRVELLRDRRYAPAVIPLFQHSAALHRAITAPPMDCMTRGALVDWQTWFGTRCDVSRKRRRRG